MDSSIVNNQQLEYFELVITCSWLICIALRSFIAMKINNCSILCAISINIFCELVMSHGHILSATNPFWIFSLLGVYFTYIYISKHGKGRLNTSEWIRHRKRPPLVQNSCSGTNFTCSNRSWNTSNWTKTDEVNQIHLPIMDDHGVCCFHVWYGWAQSMTSKIHKPQVIVPLRLSNCFINLSSWRLVARGLFYVAVPTHCWLPRRRQNMKNTMNI